MLENTSRAGQTPHSEDFRGNNVEVYIQKTKSLRKYLPSTHQINVP